MFLYLNNFSLKIYKTNYQIPKDYLTIEINFHITVVNIKKI